MRILRSSSFIALLFVALVATPAGAAWALAPEYVSSDPEDGAMLDEAPERVEVTFSEPLDPSSDLTVQDECGRTIDAGDVETQASTMSVGIAMEPVGTYKVTYLAKGVGGVTGQGTGSFTFMVHSGPSCDDKPSGGHGGHQNGGGSGNNGGAHGGNNSGGQHSGGGGDHGSMDHGTDTGSMDHSSTDHSSMGHSEDSPAHSNMSKHGDKKHGNAKHGDRNHGKHGNKGAHGLLDILDKNNEATGGPLAAGPDAIPAPDGRAVIAALALSLVMGVVGGWFLRVSGAR